MDTARIKELDELAALPTFSRSTMLQWIVPVIVAGTSGQVADARRADDQSTVLSESTVLSGSTDKLLPARDGWGWVPADDDLTLGTLDPSLAKVFGHSGRDDAYEAQSLVKRIHRYHLRPSNELPRVHGYPAMFDISAPGQRVAPQICDVQLITTGVAHKAESGAGTPRLTPDGYLVVQLRVPAKNLPDATPWGSNGQPGAAWTVTEVLRLNWALGGRAALRIRETGSQKRMGAQTYKAWTVRTVDDPSPGTPWLEFIAAILSIPTDGATGTFEADLYQAPTTLASVVLPGAEHHQASLVAHQLSELLQAFDEVNNPAGRDPLIDNPKLRERSSGIIQYVTQRCSGIVICAPPSEDVDTQRPPETPSGTTSSGTGSSDTYRRWSLADEARKYWNIALFLVLHERRELGHILDGLSDLEMPTTASDQPLETRQAELEEIVKDLGAVEQRFYQLQAWFRYRVISRKTGLQGYYGHCYEEMRIEELYDDVEQILTGISRFVQRQLDSVSNQLEALSNRTAEKAAADERKFERSISLGGAVFAVIALVIGVLSINIAGITNPEGLSVAMVIALVGVTVAVGIGVIWRFRRGQETVTRNRPTNDHA